HIINARISLFYGNIKRINKMINMTDEQVVEKLIGILQPIYQEGRLTEDEVNEIFYYATIGNSMVEHGYE
ncbi:hypothetical protein, partial [Bacteroides caccae]|uniref:hypothetical protein n=1 Tax=Bacteroides caccae TaxID=47678 RepID=UPI00237AB795